MGDAEVNLKPRMHTDAHGSRELIGSAEENRWTETIIGSGFRVQNVLGAKFLEKVYENALTHEIRKSGLLVEQQKVLSIRYDGVVVGDYVADLIVKKRIIVECKAARAIDPIHVAQTMNYLKACRLEIGLILNFDTPRLGVKRLRHQV